MARSRSIGIRELKARASKVVDEVRESGETYVVTKRGRPVAVLRSWDANDARRERVESVRRALSPVDELAERIGQAAGRRSAAAAVSRQRR